MGFGVSMLQGFGLAMVCAIVLQGSSIEGAVYKVGDTVGWTTIGNFDYQQWSANKTFRLGDIVIFSYNTQFHNVMQVNHTDYQTCNTSAPYATYTTGNDSITITKQGHHFFLCGTPGHCQSGQKVDINVLPVTLSTAPTPSPSDDSASVPATGAPAPAPARSQAAPALRVLTKSLLGKLSLALTIIIAFLLSV